MRTDVRKGAVLFAALGPAVTLLVAAGALLDYKFGLTPLCECAVKAAAVAALILLLRRWKGEPLFAGSLFSPWSLLILPPVALQFALACAPATREVGPADLALALVSVLLTVLWEELLFRGLALTLFGQEGRLPVWSAALSCVVFALCHLINLFSARGTEAILLQVGFAACCGVFLLGLFLRTRTLFAPMTAHFLLNGIQKYFDLQSGMAGVWAGKPLLFLLMLVLLFTGVWMLWKPCTKE